MDDGGRAAGVAHPVPGRHLSARILPPGHLVGGTLKSTVRGEHAPGLDEGCCDMGLWAAFISYCCHVPV